MSKLQQRVHKDTTCFSDVSHVEGVSPVSLHFLACCVYVITVTLSLPLAAAICLHIMPVTCRPLKFSHSHVSLRKLDVPPLSAH